MSLPNAITREDFYLNKIANPSDDHELPDAITRQQHYLKAIAENAGGGGGSDHPIIYSETERVVGEWIDGKTLYQITFSGNVNITSTDRAWTVIKTSEELAALNIDIAFIADGTFLIDSNDGTIYLTPQATGKGDAVGALFGVAILDNGTLSIVSQSINTGSTQYAITLQYTKKPDTAGS
jgi:hypothetical protein